MNLSELLGETTEYDKKREVEMRKPKSWLKSVSAFANGNGGMLIFGITDDNAVVGLDDIKTASEYVSQKIKNVLIRSQRLYCRSIMQNKEKCC